MWVSITPADLTDNKVAALVEALQSAALGEGQTDPTANITADVVSRIRRKIASNTANQLDADTTKIPEGLKSDAITLILARMKGRLEMKLTEQETAEISRIESDLNRIAEGRDVVEQPDTAIDAPVQTPSVGPKVSERSRYFSRSQADGL